MEIGAFFDLDGTLYAGHIWRALARHHRHHRLNLPTLYAYLALHLPLWPLMRAGLVSQDFFYQAWGTNMAWLVRDIPLERGQDIWAWLVRREIAPNLRPEVVAALNEHRARGHRVVLVSGTFQPLLEAVARHVGAVDAIATPLETTNGRYRGRIIQPLNIGQGKATRLEVYIQTPGQQVNLRDSYFYTDSIVDLPLLERVGYPVAVYPDQQLAAMAADRNWRVIGPPR